MCPCLLVGFWSVSKENRLAPSPVTVLFGQDRNVLSWVKDSGVILRPRLSSFCGEECEARSVTGSPDQPGRVWPYLTASVVFAQMDAHGNQARVSFPNFLLPALGLS